MKTLSVCMIVKNEEETIERILSCTVQFADEIIVVDTGSTDKTKELVRKFTPNIYDFKWCNDFSKARNFSFSKATKDYIMWLDADDYITADSIEKLKALKATLNDDTNNADTIYLPYQTAFNENGTCTFFYLRERIVKNLPSIFIWHDPIHEVLTPYGKTATYNDIPIQHRKIKQNENERNLKIYKALKESGHPFSARQQFYYSNELFYNNYLDDAISAYQTFLKMPDAFIENKLQAKINLSKIYNAQNKPALALQTLFDTFTLDLPRSETLCEIGHTYLSQKQYEKAIYYYKLAIQPPNPNTFAFIDLNCYAYIPHLQIALCFYFLNDLKSASKHNKLALKANPQSQIAKSNQKIYTRLLKSQNNQQ